MAASYGSVGNTTVASQTITTTTETILATADAQAVEYQNAKVIIVAFCILTTGTGVTSYTPQIRRGTLVTGTAVGTAKNVAVAASTVVSVAYMVIDTIASGFAQYVFTITQNAATGNGSADNSFIMVELLTG